MKELHGGKPKNEKGRGQYLKAQAERTTSFWVMDDVMWTWPWD